MDFSKLMAIVFGVIFIIILYFIIYYALKIMYKDIKVNNVRKNENPPKPPKKNAINAAVVLFFSLELVHSNADWKFC